MKNNPLPPLKILNQDSRPDFLFLMCSNTDEMKEVPYFERIHNEFIEGKLTKSELDKMCEKDPVLKEWISHYETLKEALKDLKDKGKI